MINTYNESKLHKTLKIYFANQNNGKTEIPYKKWICDIITDDGSIIEIQTGSLTPLKEKIQEAIKDKIHITVVHPVILEKKIENYTKDGLLVSKRKSPKKETIYTELKALTGVYNLLLNKYFSLIFIEIKSTEQRIQTEEKIQLKNRSRTFKKAWYKNGKELAEIGTENIFHGKKAYLKLLPSLPESFSSKELKEQFTKDNFPAATKNSTNLILWLFSKMGLIEEKSKIGNRKYYSIKK